MGLAKNDREDTAEDLRGAADLLRLQVLPRLASAPALGIAERDTVCALLRQAIETIEDAADTIDP